MLDYISIGKRLKEKRIEKGFTQQNVAEKLEISDEYVSKLENGKVQISLKRLADFSEVYKTPIEYFLSGTVSENEDYKMDEFMEKIKELTPKEKEVIFNIIEQVKKLRNK